MRNLFLILCLVLLAFSCTKDGEKPENLLSKETMVKVMADMQLAEAKVKNLHVSADSARELYSLYELSIFDQHGIDPEQYRESFRYYLNNYNEMTAIHNALNDTLTNRQNQIPK